MTTVVSDLAVRLRAEGVEQTAQQVRAVGTEAEKTARALQIMAEAAAKSAPTQGSAAQILELFQRTNVQPTAAALAQAASEMQKTAAAAQQAVQPTQNVAKAAVDHATAARNGAKAAQDVADGWKVSESNIVRFGTALIGINLGISLVAGAARTLHDTIVSVVDTQLDWERSLVRVRGLYGDLAPVAAAQAQSALPGVLGTTQEFLQANLSASYLTRRFGLPVSQVQGLTTAAGSAAYALGLDVQRRQQLQGAALQFAENGGAVLRDYGVEGDPLSIARAVGGVSPAQLEALTPAQLRQAQLLIGTQGLAQLALRGDQNRPGLLARQTDLQHSLDEAQNALRSGLEGGGAPATGLDQYLAYVGAAGEGAAAPGAAAFGLGPAPAQTQAMDQLKQAVQEAQKALDDNAQAIQQHTKEVQDSRDALAKLGVDVGSAAFRLLGFTGSVEDVYSIARGDIGAQAQAAVAARARSAIPTIGTPQAEINFQASQTAYAQAYQNFVARRAQGSQDNALRQYLENVATSGPADQRASARQALEEANRAAPIQARIAEAQQSSAVVDLRTAQTQANLEQITLSQRERYVQLLRDTVDIRKLDVQQQMLGLDAQNLVIRAQQAALPSQNVVSDTQYQINRASVLARARMARLLRGEDVSGLPSIDQLVQTNVNAQLDLAEAGPAALEGQRAIELAQRTATARGLSQQLTANRIQSGELGVDLANLGDLPTQTALELELVQNNRDQLSVQKELRDATKELVRIMGSRVGSGQSIDLGSLIFGEGGDVPAPSTLPGARRGPF